LIDRKIIMGFETVRATPPQMPQESPPAAPKEGPSFVERRTEANDICKEESRKLRDHVATMLLK
jgi:hypothetical protein